MKRINLLVNGCLLQVYIEGDCDRVELGKAGMVPMQRREVVSIDDTIGADEVIVGPAGIKYRVHYEVSVGEVEDL